MINQLSLLRNRSKSLIVISCQCVHKSLKSSRVPGGFSRRLIYELKIRVSLTIGTTSILHSRKSRTTTLNLGRSLRGYVVCHRRKFSLFETRLDACKMSYHEEANDKHSFELHSQIEIPSC